MSEHDHSGVLSLVRGEMPADTLLTGLSDLFRMFSDPTRMKILFALFESEMCVCALAELLGVTQPAASHQLRVLREAHLVGSRREGKTVFYYLADDHVRTIVEKGYEHLTEERNEDHEEIL